MPQTRHAKKKKNVSTSDYWLDTVTSLFTIMAKITGRPADVIPFLDAAAVARFRAQTDHLDSTDLTIKLVRNASKTVDLFGALHIEALPQSTMASFLAYAKNLIEEARELCPDATLPACPPRQQPASKSNEAVFSQLLDLIPRKALDRATEHAQRLQRDGNPAGVEDLTRASIDVLQSLDPAELSQLITSVTGNMSKFGGLGAGMAMLGKLGK